MNQSSGQELTEVFRWQVESIIYTLDMCEGACNTCNTMMPYELLVIHSFFCDKLTLEAVYLEALNISKSRDGSRSHH